MFNPAIVICSRLQSERLPGKALREINGVPILVHLIRNLIEVSNTFFIPIIVTVPYKDLPTYRITLSKYFFGNQGRVKVVGSHFDEDPLARMDEVITEENFSHAVRITHDKIFVDTESLANELRKLEKTNVDYIYGSDLHPGTGFEIISADCLKRAANKFKSVEYISYAVRDVAHESFPVSNIPNWGVEHTLLIDYPEDLKLMEVIYATLGNNINLMHVMRYLKKQPYLAYINQPPKVSIYTCAYNAENFIQRALNSVTRLEDFAEQYELIIVDDCSADKTCEIIALFACGRDNVKWVRNSENLGLASSSNIALKMARGKYVVRLDADDYFTDRESLKALIHVAEVTKAEIVYPDNYFGDFETIQRGDEKHHVGGTLFDRKALNFVKFTNGLRAYEGLDLFVRAQDLLEVAYLEQAIFMYTQRPDSMSKTNLEEREKVKREIEAKL